MSWHENPAKAEDCVWHREGLHKCNLYVTSPWGVQYQGSKSEGKRRTKIKKKREEERKAKKEGKQT